MRIITGLTAVPPIVLCLHGSVVSWNYPVGGTNTSAENINSVSLNHPLS